MRAHVLAIAAWGLAAPALAADAGTGEPALPAGATAEEDAGDDDAEEAGSGGDEEAGSEDEAPPDRPRRGPPPRVRRGPPGGRPLAIPGRSGGGEMDPEHYRALRAYRERRLTIRSEVERRPGSTYIFGHGGPYYWGWGGWYTATVVHEPGSTVRNWGVYRGPARLTVPDFLRMVDARDRYEALTRRIRRASRASHAWLGTAIAGGAGIVAGLVGMSLADDSDTWRTWNTVTFGGSVLTIGGLVGASFPMAKAARLTHDPSASLSIDEAQDLVDRYDDRLREELGISPAEAWRLETGAAPPPPGRRRER